MTIRVMTDCETLGLLPGCAILSIGACTFGPGVNVGRQRFHVRVDLLSCLMAGLTIDPATVEWWREQSEEARRALTDGERIPLDHALGQLSEFWRTTGAEEIWANGPVADVAWLEAAYRAVGEEAPWPYRAVRDYRTLWSLVGVPAQLERCSPALAHDALEDAIAQACDMERCLKIAEEQRAWAQSAPPLPEVLRPVSHHQV